TFRALPVAGRDDLWVEVRIPEGQENGRYEPPKSFDGRLVSLYGPGPRHRGLAAAIDAQAEHAMPTKAWLLVDGEQPSSSRWALALALIFVGFAVWNVAAMIRLVRKVR